MRPGQNIRGRGSIRAQLGGGIARALHALLWLRLKYLRGPSPRSGGVRGEAMGEIILGALRLPGWWQ